MWLRSSLQSLNRVSLVSLRCPGGWENDSYDPDVAFGRHIQIDWRFELPFLTLEVHSLNLPNWVSVVCGITLEFPPESANRS